MGDRAQMHIVTGGHRITLYTHWQGYRVPKIAEQALARVLKTNRISDKPYATAMIVKEFIKECGGIDDDLSVGIGTTPDDHDNQYPYFLVIDLDRLAVSYENAYSSGGVWVALEKFAEEYMPVRWAGAD